MHTAYFQARLALSLTPRTYPSYHKTAHPYYPYKTPIVSTNGIDVSTYTSLIRYPMNLLPLQNCRRLHNRIDMSL